MQALISGITGTALLVDGDRFSWLRAGEEAEPAIANPAYVRQFVSRAMDAFAIENASVESIRTHLDAAWVASGIVSSVLIVLNPDETAETRQLAYEDLEESLEDPLAVELAERQLLSTELPKNYELLTTLAGNGSVFCKRLCDLQPSIVATISAFNKISSSHFKHDDIDVRDKFIATAIREGLMRLMVLCQSGEQRKGQVHFGVDQMQSLKAISGYRALTVEWLSGISDQVVNTTDWKDNTDSVENSADTPRRALIVNSDNEFARNKVSHALLKKVFPIAALTYYKSVTSQFPSDVVARCGLAETLRSMGRFEEALRCYDETVQQHPISVLARNGLVETLGAMGRLDDAIQEYENRTQIYLDDWIAESGMHNLTRKQIASALRVSESSVKRWCDRGEIRTERTQGGHRRIPLGSLLEFLETTNRRILDPIAMGFEPFGGSIVHNSRGKLDSEATITRFEEALLSGSEAECRKIISCWYSTQGGVSSLADDLFNPTFRSVCKLLREGTIDINQERLACEICQQMVLELTWLIPAPIATAPLAMGGTPCGDPYQLATLLTEMVFREQGWRTAGLGSNLPFPCLLSAAREYAPKIFWISVSDMEDEKTFLEEYADFTKRLPNGIVLVVGGRALTDELRPKMIYSAHFDGMRQLTSLAKLLKTGSMPMAP